MSRSMKITLSLLLVGIFLISYAALAEDSQPSTQSKSDSQKSSNSKDQSQNLSDQRESADQRQVQIQFNQSRKQIQIESQNTYNGTKNNIEIEVSANDGISINFVYSGHNINQTDSNQNESHLQIKLKATKLVEFVNTNTAIPGYDSNDTLVKSFDLTNANWTLGVSNTTASYPAAGSNSTVSNYTVWKMTATTTINTNATLSFQFFVTNGFALLSGNNTLAPNLIKFTISLANYTYSSPQSQLALKMIFKSGIQSDHISNNTEDHMDGLTHGKASQVSFGNATTAGFFSWIDNYTVDGVSHSIVTSPAISVDHEDNSYNQLYFSFAHGNNITWDPKVGVTRATTSIYDILNPMSTISTSTITTKSTPGFELIVAVLSVGAIAIVTKRYRQH